jgi:bifunctional UDP-N-acetylglucosamine pyrophosphorylase / glucosamine-1-phosphate N-acetyltransferase
LKANLFFDPAKISNTKLFCADEPVWTALDKISGYAKSLFEKDWPLKGFMGLVTEPLVIFRGELDLDGDIEISPAGEKGAIVVKIDGVTEPDAAVIMPGAYLNDDRVIIGPGSVVESGALIKGPCVIGAKTEIRQGAYIRGDVIVGDNCIVGHATEIKNSIMLDGAKAGHFAYIGDSILGANVNLGAGTKLANLKMVSGTVVLCTPSGERIDTGRRKLGAILGDATETGCNSVTSPGTILGKECRVYPCVNVPAGAFPEFTIFTSSEEALSLRNSYIRSKKRA